MRTNAYKSIFTIISLFIYLISFAQNDFQGKAYYESKTTMDMENFGNGQMTEARKKEIAERIKSRLEKTFILTFNKSESLYKEDEKLQAVGQGGSGRFGSMMGSISAGPQYKNVKERILLQEQEFFGKQFLIHDSLPQFDWVMEGETKQIGKYTCFKATAVKKADNLPFNSMRRSNDRTDSDKPKDSIKPEKKDNEKELPKKIVVTAWYTPQIPLNQGPDDYWGLPGLILEINADRTTILCSKIIMNPSDKEILKAPSKGKEVSKQEYDDIVVKKMEEIRDMRGRSGNGSFRRG